jgi:nucleotide-binding universal stress UspA family protein
MHPRSFRRADVPAAEQQIPAPLRAEHHIQDTRETHERVVVALAGGPEGDTLIRRAARLAARSNGSLLAVHVASNNGLTGGSPADLARQRVLVESLGGTCHQVIGADIPKALLDFARGVNATQLVLGASRRRRIAQTFSPGVGVIAARSATIDVHLVAPEQIDGGRRWTNLAHGLTVGRRIAGFAVTLLGLPLLTIALTHQLRDLTLPSVMMLYLAAVVGAALVGGLYPALAAAVIAFLLLTWNFVPPIHHWSIAGRENILALAVFLAVAVAVAITVDLAGRRTRVAARARTEAETLSTLAGSALRGSRPLPALLHQLRETFQLTGVALLERREDAPPCPGPQHDPAVWRVAAAVGDQPHPNPAQGDSDVLVDGDVSLVLRGHPLAAADRRVVAAFAAQAALALRQERLEKRAAAVRELTENRQAAHCSAVRGQPRRSQPPCHGQGRCRHPAQHRRRFQRRRPRRTGQHRRRGPQPARPSGREPARHQPPAGRRSRGFAPAGQPCRPNPPQRGGPRYRGSGRPHSVARRPAPGARRRGPARTGPGQPAVQCGEPWQCRSTCDDHGQPARQHSRGPRHRPRTRGTRGRPGPHLPTVPTPGQTRQRHRRRPRPGPVPRSGRRHGRHHHPRGHTRRRPHDDTQPARRRTGRRRA